MMGENDISADLSEAVEALVRRELGPFGVDQVETLSIEDHLGDPAIRVLVHDCKANANPDPRIASALLTKLNDLLFERREQRFGYIAHRMPKRVRTTARRKTA